MPCETNEPETEQENPSWQVEEDWDVSGLAEDLKEAPWEETERNRVDRRIFLESADQLESLVQAKLPEDEVAEAEESDTLPELLQDAVQEYLDELAEAVAEELGEHVYGEFYEGDVFLGQYEEGEKAKKLMQENPHELGDIHSDPEKEEEEDEEEGESESEEE